MPTYEVDYAVHVVAKVHAANEEEAEASAERYILEKIAKVDLSRDFELVGAFEADCDCEDGDCDCDDCDGKCEEEE